MDEHTKQICDELVDDMIIKEDLRINLPHIENPKNKPLSDSIKSILEKAKDIGALDFRVERFRKCDFCDKRLEEGDDFVTEYLKNGDILDKCSECSKK